jgi:hypothetical protein
MKHFKIYNASNFQFMKLIISIAFIIYIIIVDLFWSKT